MAGNYIGLMLVQEEDDILEWALRNHTAMCDWVYVLDGTAANTHSRALCERYGVAGYITDAEVGGPQLDGIREHVYQLAVASHGYDNWYLLLHPDERWLFDPRDVPGTWDGDGYGFRLPFYVPLEPWDDTQGVEQLHWRFEPGWPEFRMFRGGPGVHFAPTQHSNVQPNGLERVVWTPWQIAHYPFRSGRSQELRREASFSTSNYHLAGDVWAPDDVERAYCDHHRELVYR